MELTIQLQVEDPATELIDFLGYEIPERFSVLFWISPQDFDDPFTVKFHYEIGDEGTPSVVETRISGSNSALAGAIPPLDGVKSAHSGFYYQGRVFRHHLSWVDKNYKDLFITGLQIAIQREFKLEEFGRFFTQTVKKLDLPTLRKFEAQLREELGSRRKLTPEFLKEVLKKRERYFSEHGSHRGFNQRLAEQEGVTPKAIEKWIKKAEDLPKKPIRKRKGK